MDTGSLKPLLCCPRQILSFWSFELDFMQYEYPTFVTSFPLWNTKEDSVVLFLIHKMKSHPIDFHYIDKNRNVFKK